MNPRRNKSITILELLVAISILGFLVIGISSIDLFSRYQFENTDRRSKLQNEASYILEHMTKEISKGIGNENAYGSNTVINTSAILGNTAIRVYIDLASDGQSAGDGQRGTQGDRWIAYRFRPADATPAAERSQVWYYPNYTDADPGTYQVLGSRVYAFSPSASATDNYVAVNITTCWDCDESPLACGMRDNPKVNLLSRIRMQGVSTN